MDLIYSAKQVGVKWWLTGQLVQLGFVLTVDIESSAPLAGQEVDTGIFKIKH